MQMETTGCRIDGYLFSTLFITDDGRLKLKPFIKEEKNNLLKKAEENLAKYLLNTLIAEWDEIDPTDKGLNDNEILEVLVCEFCFRSPLNGGDDASFTSIIASEKNEFFEAYKAGLKKFAEKHKKIGLLMNDRFNFFEFKAESKQTRNGNVSFINEHTKAQLFDLNYFAQMEGSTLDRTSEPAKLIVTELKKEFPPLNSNEHFIFLRFPLRLGRLVGDNKYDPEGFQIGLGIFVFRSNISIDNMLEPKKEKLAKSLSDPLLLEIASISLALLQEYFLKIALTQTWGNVTHRLPGTLDSMIYELERQRKTLPDHYRESFKIPPQFYVLNMVSSIQRGLVPRWQRYEKLCLREGKYLLNDKIIRQLWEDIAMPIGLSRVQLDPGKVFRKYWNKIHRPELSNKGSGIALNNENDVSALLCLCVPLLIEAFQHAFMWSILEYDTTSVNKQAKVEVELEKNEVVINNPAHNKRNPLASFSKREGQQREIKEIERLIDFAWTVKSPEPVNYGDLWVVRITRKKENANE